MLQAGHFDTDTMARFSRPAQGRWMTNLRYW
jgi:hypothetical protein